MPSSIDISREIEMYSSLIRGHVIGPFAQASRYVALLFDS